LACRRFVMRSDRRVEVVADVAGKHREHATNDRTARTQRPDQSQARGQRGEVAGAAEAQAEEFDGRRPCKKPGRSTTSAPSPCAHSGPTDPPVHATVAGPRLGRHHPHLHQPPTHLRQRSAHDHSRLETSSRCSSTARWNPAEPGSGRERRDIVRPRRRRRAQVFAVTPVPLGRMCGSDRGSNETAPHATAADTLCWI
jgi:hypothetical protein